MNKGLQALWRLKGEDRVGIYDEINMCQDFDIAEYYLKAIDILKEKNINVYWLKTSPNLSRYNLAVGTSQKLQRNEYALLKEVLGDD